MALAPNVDAYLLSCTLDDFPATPTASNGSLMWFSGLNEHMLLRIGLNRGSGSQFPHYVIICHSVTMHQGCTPSLSLPKSHNPRRGKCMVPGEVNYFHQPPASLGKELLPTIWFEKPGYSVVSTPLTVWFILLCIRFFSFNIYLFCANPVLSTIHVWCHGLQASMM